MNTILLNLCYGGFQHCRLALPETPAVLTTLLAFFPAVHATKTLISDLPNESISVFWMGYQSSIRENSPNTSAWCDLPLEGEPLFHLIAMALHECELLNYSVVLGRSIPWFSHHPACLSANHQPFSR